MNSLLSRRTLLGAGLALAGVATLGGQPQTAAATPPRWRLLADGDGPSPRWDHTLAGDDEGEQLFLFGGRDAGFAAVGDTWVYDLSAKRWEALDAIGPSPRFGHAVAIDQQARTLYLFGGQAGEQFFNDTWGFDLDEREWRQIDTGDGAVPSPRYGLAAVLDGNGRLLVSHGFTFEGRFDDTWSLDLERGAWTDVSPGEGERPLKRCLHEMVWDAPAARMLLYGGCSSGFGPCPQGDLWAFDPADRHWTQLAFAEGPSARSNPAMVFDTEGARSLLIGGLTEAGYATDLWTGTAAADDVTWQSWSTEGDAPSPRASHDAVMTRGAVYLFGGTGDGVFGDLWKLSFAEDAS